MANVYHFSVKLITLITSNHINQNKTITIHIIYKQK